MKLQFGRNVYGLGAIAFGLITIFWRQIDALGNISHPAILVYIVGALELIGGFAVQWQRTVKFGALTLILIYLIFSIYLIPPVIETPSAYTYWGNFFEQFSVVLGGIIIFASTISGQSQRAAMIERAAYRCFGVCVISYSLYQLFYLQYTANLVPRWIPPAQMFWAVATTIAFALAAFAVISGRSALLASRLLTTMFILFGLLVWLPASLIDPYTLSNWTSSAQNLAVAGSAWIVADLLSERNINSLKWSFRHASVEQYRDASN